jgi:hypothetical protein
MIIFILLLLLQHAAATAKVKYIFIEPTFLGKFLLKHKKALS